MHMDYFDRMAYQEMQEDAVWNRLEEQRQEAINAISTIVRQDDAESFGMILAAAIISGSNEAETIAERLNLTEIDFLAIEKKFSEYKQYLIEQGWNV